MWKLVVFGLVVQCLFLVSVFDICKEGIYVSDISYSKQRLTDRVVIFVVSGLRPDMVYQAFDERKTDLPLWSNLLINGILKAEIPTTSRNGFTALTAGVNEGLLSVLPFSRNIDTIFDRANSTLYIGPESTLENIKIQPYTRLNYKTDLNNSIYNQIKLNIKELNNSSIILIHLNNIIKEINSYECLFNCIDIIVNVFNQIENIYRLIEDQTKNSTYILLADHGIRQDGRFGGNTNNEIETFLGIWGTGISKMVNIDLDQVQIANLISVLLGIDLPRNSLAITPINLLKLTEDEKLYNMAINALQFSSIAGKATHQIDLLLKLFKYIHFEPFIVYKKMLENQQIVENVIKTNNLKEYKKNIEELLKLSMNTILSMKFGMRFVLHSLIHISYSGWIIMLITCLLSQYNKINAVQSDKSTGEEVEEEEEKRKKSGKHKICVGLNFMFVLISLLLFIFVISHNWPFQYYLYWLAPIIIWRNVFKQLYKWHYLKSLITIKTLPQLAANSLLILLTYELLVWSGKYKLLLSIGLITVTAFLTIKCMLTTSSNVLLLTFITTGIMLTITLLISVISKQLNIKLLNISALIWITAGVSAAFFMRFTFQDYLITLISLVQHFNSLIIINILSIYPIGKKELKIIWFQICFAFIIPFFGGKLTRNRLKQIALCLSSIYLLFSIRHEPFVFFLLFVQLMAWFILEDEFIKKIQLNNIDIPIIFTIFFISSYYIMDNSDDLNFIDTKFTERFQLIKNQLIDFILLITKHCLILFLLQIFFISIAKKRGNYNIPFILILLILNCIGHRYLIELLLFPDFNIITKQLTRHCLIQITIIFLLASFYLAEIFTSLSITMLHDKMKYCIKQNLNKKSK